MTNIQWQSVLIWHIIKGPHYWSDYGLVLTSTWGIEFYIIVMELNYFTNSYYQKGSLQQKCCGPDCSMWKWWELWILHRCFIRQSIQKNSFETLFWYQEGSSIQQQYPWLCNSDITSCKRPLVHRHLWCMWRIQIRSGVWTQLYSPLYTQWELRVKV